MGDEDKTIEQLISELNELAESFKTKPMFEGLFQFAPDAIVVVNRGGDIVQINKQAEKMFGYSTDEVFGKPVEIFVPERFRKLHVEQRNNYMSSPHIRFLGTQLELYAIRKDGSEFPVDIALGPLETEKGTVVMALVRDITERKRAEKNFQRFIESLPDAIVIIDRNFNILHVNAQTEKIFGYKRKELLGKPYDMLIPQRFRDTHAKSCRDYFAKPTIMPMALHFGSFAKGKDGSEFPVEINMSPIENEKGINVVTTIRTIVRK